MASDTFDRVGAALGDRLDAALKGFMQDVVDIASGSKQIASLGGPKDDFSSLKVQELQEFIAQLGGAEFGIGFRSRQPKLVGCLLRPGVVLPTGMKPSDMQAKGVSGSISVGVNITF